jgi:multicomponent Na+:H+ antiporter subunit B
MTSMPSLILRATARIALPLLLLFSIFLLLRGHDEPGGGFIGGLVGAMGFALYVFAFSVEAGRQALWIEPRMVVGLGLTFAVVSGIIGTVLHGDPFFTSQWWSVSLPLLGDIKLSSPLIFDIGVYMVVLGSVMTIVLTLAQAED